MHIERCLAKQTVVNVDHLYEMEIEHLVVGVAAVVGVLIIVMWVLGDSPPSNRDRR